MINLPRIRLALHMQTHLLCVAICLLVYRHSQVSSEISPDLKVPNTVDISCQHTGMLISTCDAVIVYNGLNRRRTDGGTEGDSGGDEGDFVSSSVS